MNENQPLSACCGAEIGTVRTHGRPFYIGCFSCNNPIPASKGDGGKEIDSFLEKLNIHHRGMVCFNDALAVEHLRFLIQTAIDEAVENAVKMEQDRIFGP